MAMPTKSELADLRKAKFLAAFRRYKIVSHAARRVGVPRQRIYEWCADDPEFKAALNNAQQEIVDQLELELHRLATGKYSRPIASAGKIVGHEEIRDVKALEMLLKAYRPKLYRERTNLEITGDGGGPVKVVKQEVTATLLADVTRILMESGIVGSDGTFGDPRRRALAAENDGHGVNALDVMRELKR